MTPGRKRQAEALRKAAASKSQRSRDAAERGLQQVIDSGEPVTFASVARAAQVSQYYLHSHPDLADRIRGLRARGATRSTAVPAPRRREQSRGPVHAPCREEIAKLRRQVNDLQVQLGYAQERLRRLRSGPDDA